MTAFAFGQEEDMKAVFPQENIFQISYFGLEKCVVSHDYDSIFTSNRWSEIRTQWGRSMSSSGAYGYHYWQFHENKIKITNGFHPYVGAKNKGEHAETLLMYRFDKNNNLLFVRKFVRKIRNKEESVLKPYFYDCGDKEVLVLYLYPNTDWNTPVEAILKEETTHYKTFIRWKEHVFN